MLPDEDSNPRPREATTKRSSDVEPGGGPVPVRRCAGRIAPRVERRIVGPAEGSNRGPPGQVNGREAEAKMRVG